MRIIIKQDEQKAEITIDLKDIYYSYAIRDAIMLALKCDGFTDQTINEVFNLGDFLEQPKQSPQ